MSESTSALRSRFNTELPVLRTAKQGYSLPFRHAAEMIRLGWLAICGNVITELLAWLCARHGVSKTVQGLISLTINEIVSVPFAVAWIRLAVLGPQSIKNRPWFVCGRVELTYVGLRILWIAGFIAGIIIPGAIAIYVRASSVGSNSQAPALASFVSVLSLLASMIVDLRFTFLWPSIAIQRFAGILPTWNQTRGYLERLVAIYALILLPSNCSFFLLRHLQSKAGSFAAVTISLLIGVLYLFWFAVMVGSMALAYKGLVIDMPDSSSSGSQSGGGGMVLDSRSSSPTARAAGQPSITSLDRVSN